MRGRWASDPWARRRKTCHPARRPGIAGKHSDGRESSAPAPGRACLARAVRATRMVQKRKGFLSGEVEGQCAIDVSVPGFVDVRIATLSGALPNLPTQLLLLPRVSGSCDLENERLQVAQLPGPLLRIRAADT